MKPHILKLVNILLILVRLYPILRASYNI